MSLLSAAPQSPPKVDIDNSQYDNITVTWIEVKMHSHAWVSLVKRLMSRYTMGTLSLMGKVYVTTIVLRRRILFAMHNYMQSETNSYCIDTLNSSKQDVQLFLYQ